MWFDPLQELSPEDVALNLDFPWLTESRTPPENDWVAPDVHPLASDETPPASHPGTAVQADPACPSFVKQLTRDPPPCGGLKGAMRERANRYQLATVADPRDWNAIPPPWTERHMRHPSAVDAYRMLAHYAWPNAPSPEDRDKLLRDEVLHDGSPTERTHLQTWAETGDFVANGVLRLLYLYSDKRFAPDPARPTALRPLIPCDLQAKAKEQLRGFKYFLDEPARRDASDPVGEAVYWSENHQLLYATAEYLAGQLMPDEWFQPNVHWREDPAKPWKTHTDTQWGMRGSARLGRAYPRLVRWLDHRLMFGFSEWDSPVYYEYDIAGLLNLIDFCDDRAVADKATIALDIVLLDVARFFGQGRAGATAGRAYPSQKYTGWGTKLADTLQILFGEWPIDPRAEDVMETWRIDAFEALRQENYDNFYNAALAQASADGYPDPAVIAVQAVGQKMADWDRDNLATFQRQKFPPLSTSWVAADSPGAHSLATSDRYCVPLVMEAYAQEPAVAWFERSRVSISFDEGPRDYGIGFNTEPDLLAWWSRGGFGTPFTILGSRDLARASDLEDVSPFSDIPGLFSLPDSALEAGAAMLEVESMGSCLTTSNITLWRQRGVSLSSTQKFRFGEVGRQAQIWQASLDPYVTVWSTYPAAKSVETDSDGPNWWGGNAAQPRVVQRDGALICIHDSNLLSYTNLTYGHRSHAWFPVRMFDEAFEVRPDPDDEDNQSIVIDLLARRESVRPDLAMNVNRGGVWWFGRRGAGYLGLFSAKPSAWLELSGRWAEREIRCDDRVNVFVCQVASDDQYATLDDFMKACCQARVSVALGVYQPSNPFVDIACSYDVLGGRRLTLNLEERWPFWHGSPFSDEEFPRWENPWTAVRWRERQYTVGGPTIRGQQPTLDHDCVAGVRTGTGL